MRTIHSALALVLCATLVGAQGKADVESGQKPGKKPEKSEPTVVEIGDVVPADLAISNLAGDKKTFGDLRGKVVFVHFWSTSCPWEKKAEPKLTKLEKAYAEKGVVVLAINANQNEIGAVPDAAAFKAKKADDKPYQHIRETLKKKKLDFDVWVDHGNVVSTALQARSTPHCFVIDEKGVLRYAGALDSDGRSEKGGTPYVKNALDAVLADEAVETKTSRPYGCTIKKASPRRKSRSSGV